MSQPPAESHLPAEAGPAGVEEPAETLDRTEEIVRSRFLHGDEQIILLIKPSLWYIPLACLNSLGVIVGLALILIIVESQRGLDLIAPGDVATLAGMLVALRLTWQFFEWLSRIYVLTDHRVLRVKGVLQTRLFEAPLEQLADPEINVRMRESFFGLGSIALGTTDAKYFQAYWQMVKDPADICDQIEQAIDRRRNGMTRAGL